jgi:hypothetical protein
MAEAYGDYKASSTFSAHAEGTERGVPAELAARAAAVSAPG